jgi:twinkle protein
MNAPQNEAQAKAFAQLMVSEAEIDRHMNERDTADHVNVKVPSSFLDQLVSHFDESEGVTGDCLPWEKTQNLIRLRHSEVTIWNGINGHGKSNVLGQVILHQLKGRKACIASLEMKPVTTLARMCRQALGGRNPTSEFISNFVSRADSKLWLYDQQGTVSADKVIGVMYYAAEKLLVEHFVVDSLMKCGIGEDDYNGQKRFVDRLCAFAKDTECHVHLVTHAKKAENEHDLPGKMSVKGSGSITDQVDNVLTVWRNKKKEQKIAAGDTSEDTKNLPDAMICCDKQRNGEWEGRIALWFDVDSMRYRESPRSMNYIMSEFDY